MCIDHSLFLKHVDTSTTIILVYVDDIVLIGNNSEEITHITMLLDQDFKIKNLGDLTYFLGFEVARNRTEIHLCQRKYTLDLLQEAGMIDCAPMPTPMVHSTPLSAEQGTQLNENDCTTYRRLIGRLIYLTNTKPDISFSVNKLSQYVYAPTTVHQRVAHRILRYLKLAPWSGIFFHNDNLMQVEAYSDSDWATGSETRRSTTGSSIYLGNSLISWKSKKQQTISRNSSKVKYLALAVTTCEIQWLIYLLQDLQLHHYKPALLYCDNQSAIQIISNQVFHERIKHIEIDSHVVREKLNNSLIKLLPISSSMQAADIFMSQPES